MRYLVRATVQGEERQLELTADDEEQLRQDVRSMGMVFLQATPIEEGRSLFKRKQKFNQSLFTQELIALLEAGLSLIETIETLRDKSKTEIEKRVQGRIVDALYEGMPLSRALEQQPEVFPPLYVATVASAERTGHLAEALKRYHQYDARLAAVKKKIVASLVYPVIVLSTGGLIILFLAFYVIPKFSQIYASMKNLPFAAKLMLWWGDLVHAHGLMLFAGIAATCIGIGVAIANDGMRARAIEAFWSMPRMVGYQRLFALTRFFRTLGLLLAGGMSVVASMELSAQLLPANLRASLNQALESIKAGQSLSTALPAANLTTPVAERLIRVGEQSGDLAGMITRAAEFCDEELDRAIDTLMRMVEPVIMLFVGAMVGTIVFLLYMPIFQLAGSVG